MGLALAALRSPARADDDREVARQEFARGQAADKARDYSAAIEHYLRANELVPHPFAMFNVAADYEHLKNFREAALWYQRYLDASPAAANRAEVARLLAELKNRPAPLSVRSIPDGAQVSIDGAPAGATPLSSTIRGGKHRIGVERDGQREEREVDVEYAEPVDVQFTLHGPSGTLDVQGTPLGAFVSVDGVVVGRVPAQLVVQPGQHRVHVEQYGYQPMDQSITVEPGATAPVAVALQAGGLGVYAARKIDLRYFLGVAAASDVRGDGTLLEGELGIRVQQYEAVIRTGRAAGVTAVDFMVRWSFTNARIAPFVGLGYSYIGSGLGYEVLGGLKWDVAEGEKVGFTLRADIGARAYTRTVTDSMDIATSESGWLYPITLTLEAVYR